MAIFHPFEIPKDTTYRGCFINCCQLPANGCIAPSRYYPTHAQFPSIDQNDEDCTERHHFIGGPVLVVGVVRHYLLILHHGHARSRYPRMSKTTERCHVICGFVADLPHARFFDDFKSLLSSALRGTTCRRREPHHPRFGLWCFHPRSSLVLPLSTPLSSLIQAPSKWHFFGHFCDLKIEILTWRRRGAPTGYPSTSSEYSPTHSEATVPRKPSNFDISRPFCRG